jgi:hypothetical protein
VWLDQDSASKLNAQNNRNISHLHKKDVWNSFHCQYQALQNVRSSEQPKITHTSWIMARLVTARDNARNLNQVFEICSFGTFMSDTVAHTTPSRKQPRRFVFLGGATITFKP